MEPIAAPEQIKDFTVVQVNLEGQLLFRKTTLLKPICITHSCLTARSFLIVGLISSLGLIILGSSLLANGKKNVEIAGAVILGVTILYTTCCAFLFKKMFCDTNTDDFTYTLPLSCVLVGRQQLEVVRTV